VSRCTAVDYNGQEVTFDPTAPPATPSPHSVDPSTVGFNALYDVACPSTSDCVAVDSSGNAIEGDPAQPSGWTVTPIPGAAALYAVTCSSVARCAAVDGEGNAFVGLKATPTNVSCVPGSVTVGVATTCTATVTDPKQGAFASTPSGSVAFTTGDPGAFGAGSCTLAQASAISGVASCQVSYAPSAVGSGTHTITATYSGDGSHPASSGTAHIGVSAPAGPPPPPGQTHHPPPVLAGVGLTNRVFVVGRAGTPTFATAARARRHRTGTTFVYKLSEPATVKIVIGARVAGRLSGGRCVAPSRKLRHARRCTGVIGRGTLTRISHLGVNRVAFSGRIGARALRPGRYQATLIATDAARQSSRRRTIFFTVVRR
jgi:hypothetical protein